MKKSKKNSLGLRRRKGGLVSLCLVAVLALVVGAGIFNQRSAEVQTLSDAGSVTNLSENVAEINTVEQVKEEPIEVVSDATYGDYEKGAVLLLVDESTDLAVLDAMLDSTDFVLAKDDSKQNVSAGFVKVGIAENASMEQAIGTFEAAGYTAQPNYIFYPADDELIEEESDGADAGTGSSVAAAAALEDDQASDDLLKSETVSAKSPENDLDMVARLLSPAADGEAVEGETSAESSASYINVNDPGASQQWALQSLDVFRAWNLEKCSSKVSVAIIDTGALTTHEDLRNNIKATYNAVTGTEGTTLGVSNPATDDDGHGTHVAGIVAADADNTVGAAGVSYDANLIIIKASSLDNQNKSVFSIDNLAKAYDWLTKTSGGGNSIATRHNVRVVNMSIGAPDDINKTALVYSKITAARNAGILTVCAAGNSASNATPPYNCIPGDYSDCFTVINLEKQSSGAPNDSSGTYHVSRLNSSNYNVATGDLTKAKTISAPGTSIYSTLKAADNQYGELSGTSMAAPAISGIAALIFAYSADHGLDLSAAQVQALIEKTATYLGSGTGVWDAQTGYGEADAYHALQILNAQIGNDSIPLGQTNQLSLVCSDGSNTPASGWSWASSNPNVLSVNNSSYTANARAAGSADLTATFRDRQGNVLRTVSKTVTVGTAAAVSDEEVKQIRNAIRIELDVPESGYTYDGTAKTPSAKVFYNNQLLSFADGDYALTYRNNTNANSESASHDQWPQAVVTYNGVEITKEFRIKPADINLVTVSVSDQKYTGSSVTQLDWVYATFKGEKITLGTDYTLSFPEESKGSGWNNVGPCFKQAIVMLQGKGNFTGTKQVPFSIIGDMTNYASVASIGDQIYTGSEVKPSLDGKITFGDTVIYSGDYEATYSNNVKVGQATVTIKGKNACTGTITKTFNIVAKDIGTGGVSVNVASPQYTGSALTPTPTVTYAGKTLVKGTDYEISGYDNNVSVGTGATITIKGKGPNFSGTLTTKFSISAISIADAKIDGYSNLVYNGKNQTQGSVKVTLNGKTLVPGTDYSIEYRKLGSNATTTPKEVGVYQMVVKGRGVYMGSATRNFQIYTPANLKNLSGATVSTSNMTRNATGKALAPSVTIKYGSTTLKNGTDYYLTYNNSTTTPTKAGTYTVRAVGKGSYTGTITLKDSFKLLQGPSQGQVQIASVYNQTYVLDAAGSSPKKGANVSIWTDNAGSNQKWQLVLGTDGYYTIRSIYNQDYRLDAAGATPKQGSNVSIWTDNSGSNQKWVIEQSGSNYVIRSAANPNLVLDAAGASPKRGANISAWRYNGGKNQQWKIVPVTSPSFDSSKTYEISSVSNPKYVLDAAGATPKIGANVSIWDGNKGKNQRWKLIPAGNGYYYIQSLADTNFILDAAGSRPGKGSNVSIWKNNKGNNQKWKIDKLANGTYIIRNAANQSLVLDASGSTPRRGANVSVWSNNGGNNQKWNIKAV